jgi:hypothetical protein
MVKVRSQAWVVRSSWQQLKTQREPFVRQILLNLLISYNNPYQKLEKKERKESEEKVTYILLRLEEILTYSIH